MSTLTRERCGFCGTALAQTVGGFVGSRIVGVEYPYGHPGRYDGISELRCPDCHVRVGRWSGRVLEGDDYERPLARIPEGVR